MLYQYLRDTCRAVLFATAGATLGLLLSYLTYGRTPLEFVANSSNPLAVASAEPGEWRR
jgi:hypothetical protein